MTLPEKTLAFDTETSGLLDFRADLMAPHQPRIVQLAAIIFAPSGEEIHVMSRIIKPDGWTIDEGAQNVHGISLERCHDEGVPMIEALEEFNELKKKCQARVGFNVTYDKRMLAREANLYGVEHNSDDIDTYCAMNLAKPICNMAPTAKMSAAGRNFAKPPKLIEAYEFFFKKPFDGAHDALADVRATKEVFLAIVNGGHPYAPQEKKVYVPREAAPREESKVESIF